MDYKALQQATFKRMVSNRKLNDKGSIAYLIGMIEGHSSYYGFYYMDIPRENLLNRLLMLIETDDNWNTLMKYPSIVSQIDNQIKNTITKSK